MHKAGEIDLALQEYERLLLGPLSTVWYPDITESEEMDIARGKAIMTPTMSLERLKAAILKNTARVRMQEVEHVLKNGAPDAQKTFAEDMEGETIIEDFVDGLSFDMSDLKALLDLSAIANEMQLRRLSNFCLETLLILSRENTRPMLRNKDTLLDDQATDHERRANSLFTCSANSTGAIQWDTSFSIASIITIGKV